MEAGADERNRVLEPLDPELWQLTRAAVLAVGAAVDEYLGETHRWRPRYRLGAVGKFDSGWPHLTRPTFAGDNAPVEYSSLVGSNRGQLTPIAYRDVAELATLLDYVRGRDELRDRLAPGPDVPSGDLVVRMIEFEAAELPLSLLDRSRSIGANSDDGLLPLYLERERAWLLDPLPFEYVIPMVLSALDIDETLDIDGNIRLERLNDPTQAARATATSHLLSSVPDALIGAATHAIVLGGRELPNPGPGRRHFGDVDEQSPFVDADFVCEALRIVTHIDVGYAQVLRRPLGWADDWKYNLPALTQVTTLRRYPEHFDNYGWLRSPNSIPRQTLDLLPTVVAALRSADPNIRLASRRLSLAALRDNDDDRTVDACIGLEALLGEGRDELRHRISLRAATALATRPDEPANPDAVYTAMKKVYDHRSAVVHGASGDRSRDIRLGERTYTADTVAIMLLREILSDALTRPGGWTPQSLDAALLVALARPAGGAWKAAQST
jgi:hypothetical protein